MKRRYLTSALLITSLILGVFIYNFFIIKHEGNSGTSTPNQKVILYPKTAMMVPVATQGDKGIIIEISVEIVKGKNRMLIDAKLVIGSTFQKSARTAVQVATTLLNMDLSEADVIFNVNASVSKVDGASAGAAMTTLVYSAITGMGINQSVMVTGAIKQDGSIGKVGGIMEKIEAASKADVKTLLIPEGQSIQTILVKKEVKIDFGIFEITSFFYEYETIDMVEYAQENFGITLVEVRDIEQVLSMVLIQK